MIFDIYKDFVSQSSYFKSHPDPVTLGGVGGGTHESGKTLRVYRSGWNSVERISACPRYVIDITGPDTPSLEEFGGFASLDTSGQARTMKVGRRIRDQTILN